MFHLHIILLKEPTAPKADLGKFSIYFQKTGTKTLEIEKMCIFAVDD